MVTFLLNAVPSMPPIKHYVIETGSANWVPTQTSRELEMKAEKTPWGLRVSILSPTVPPRECRPRTLAPTTSLRA